MLKGIFFSTLFFFRGLTSLIVLCVWGLVMMMMMMMSLETVCILMVAASSGSYIGEKNPIEGLPGLKGPGQGR
jgi:hypothetical protein